MRMIMALMVLVLVGCGGASEDMPAPTATWAPTATAVPTSTGTPTSTPTAMPTSTPTATASPTATSTPTTTATPAAVTSSDLAHWELPLTVAGFTLMTIDGMKETATGLRAGTLPSVEAGGQLFVYQIALGAIAQKLDEASLTNRPARYEESLRANLVAVYRIVERWQQGELSSATVDAELGPVQAASEQTLNEILDELRQLGVSQEWIDEFMAVIREGAN